VFREELFISYTIRMERGVSLYTFIFDLSVIALSLRPSDLRTRDRFLPNEDECLEF